MAAKAKTVHAKHAAQPATVKEIYEKYSREPVVDAAKLSDLLSFANMPELKRGLFFIFLFFVAFAACLLIMPPLLGSADASIAASFNLKTIVPISSLLIAVVVVLCVFQIQFAFMERKHREQMAEFLSRRKRLQS